MRRLRRLLVENFKAVTQKGVARARNQIRKLVGDEIRLVPTQAGDHLGAELNGDFVSLPGVPDRSQLALVAGAGFEPATFGL